MVSDYQEPTRTPERPAKVVDSETLLLDDVQMYYDEMRERLVFWYSYVFPMISGKRQPLYQEAWDDRAQFLMLRETARKLTLVKDGEMEHDMDTERFEADEDGARARLLELTAQFEGEV